MTDQTAPTLTPDPDGDGVILHLPEITHVDTQVWAADVGLTEAGLAALRTLLAPTTVEQPPVDRAALRDQLLHALDFAYCQGVGYATPEQLLAAYDAAQQPSDRTGHREENDYESA